MTSLTALLERGQSPWLDYIRRSLLTSGELKRMVEQDGITGVTINPTIFEKAIAGSHDYDASLQEILGGEPHLAPAELYERLAVEDVRLAADVLRPVFDRTGGKDGFVSLRSPPDLPMIPPVRSRRLDASGGRSTGRIFSLKSRGRRRSSGDRGASRRGHQYQHHASVLAFSVRSGRASLSARISARSRPRATCLTSLPSL